MDVHIKNTYDLFFHPFKGEGLTKKGFGRLAASVAIFIGTIGLYHLVVGSIQKWRIKHMNEREVSASSLKTSSAYEGVHGNPSASSSEEISSAPAFFQKHPQVIRPSEWKEWAAAAGLDIQVITDEEAFNALPENMEEILESPCRIFGGEKRVEEARMYVYIPPGLTAEDLGKILKTRFPNTEAGYRHIWVPILEALKDQATIGGWVEMTKDVIPGSKSKVYASQQAMVQELCNEDEHYEVPKALEAIACCLAWHFHSNERLLGNDPWTYTRCQEQVKGCQVVVGGFGPAGLDVLNLYYDEAIGVAALRRIF